MSVINYLSARKVTVTQRGFEAQTRQSRSCSWHDDTTSIWRDAYVCVCVCMDLFSFIAFQHGTIPTRTRQNPGEAPEYYLLVKRFLNSHSQTKKFFFFFFQLCECSLDANSEPRQHNLRQSHAQVTLLNEDCEERIRRPKGSKVLRSRC